MKRLVTGIDENGRSCIARAEDVAFDAVNDGLKFGALFATDVPPPSGEGGRSPLLDLGVGAGRTQWGAWSFAPDAEVSMHRTETMDFDTVVRGSVEIVLDDGTHLLEAGDCVVVTGVDHGWRAGPDGCVMTAMNMRTAPRD